ncbi:MAG: DUF2569 domain-containing protein [Candidatus Levybacteria bacterium]|nr:DUF2569 domain-containing protein [Candidatus Levybacteria bacterium]
MKTSEANKANKQNEAKISSPEIKNKEVLQNDKKVKAGLGGWLALVGLGLIVTILRQGYEAFDYLSLLSGSYEIPGYSTILRFEFVFTIVFTIFGIYLLYLYFKKNRNFPKYYIIVQIVSVAYVLLDYLSVASLTVPTQELQKAINDVLSQSSGTIGQAIIGSIIWVTYMKKSKQVKATFINK